MRIYCTRKNAYPTRYSSWDMHAACLTRAVYAHTSNISNIDTRDVMKSDGYELFTLVISVIPCGAVVKFSTGYGEARGSILDGSSLQCVLLASASL